MTSVAVGFEDAYNSGMGYKMVWTMAALTGGTLRTEKIVLNARDALDWIQRMRKSDCIIEGISDDDLRAPISESELSRRAEEENA